MPSILIKSVESTTTPRGRPFYRIRHGKREIEVPGDVNELKRWIRSQFDDNELLAFALALWMARNPSLDNPAMIVGRTLTLDFTAQVNLANAVVRVT